MIDMSGVSRVMLYPGVTDMRWGMPGLIAIVGNPEPGTLYVFCGSGGRMLKMLLVEGDAISLCCRKLRKRRYLYPASGEPYATDPENLVAMVRCAALAVLCESRGVPSAGMGY